MFQCISAKATEAETEKSFDLVEKIRRKQKLKTFFVITIRMVGDVNEK